MNQKEILHLIEQTIKGLEGEWILVGGALLHYLGLSDRQTLDIDLVPKGDVTNRDQIKVIDIATKNGFPPETINFAAEYFLKKQKNWKKELVLMVETKKAKIYRPSKKLFCRLKEQRGTETDLLDIKLFQEGVED